MIKQYLKSVIFLFTLVTVSVWGDNLSPINVDRENSINHYFFLDEYKSCDILLFAKYVKSKDPQWVVQEIVKDTTKTIKIGDTVFLYSFQMVKKKEESEVLYCRRKNRDFLNFMKDGEISDAVYPSIKKEQIKDLFNQIKQEKNNLKSQKKNFKTRQPYIVNRDFFIQDLPSCDILLLMHLSKQSESLTLSVSKVLHDKTHSASTTDALTIPQELLDKTDYKGALFCRRDNFDFLNFFDKNDLIYPNMISVDIFNQSKKQGR